MGMADDISPPSDTSLEAISTIGYKMARLGIDTIKYTIFTEDFESPVVPGPNYFVSSPTLANWVRATAGYGAGSHGIDNKLSGNWIGEVGNNQGYNFNYTNSGLMTADGAVGKFDASVGKYFVEFDLQYDLGITGLNGATGGTGSPKVGNSLLRVEFWCWGAGDIRWDARASGDSANGFKLAEVVPSVANDGVFHKFEITYSPDSVLDVGKNGMDLAVRVRGKTYGAVIDNVKVFKQ